MSNLQVLARRCPVMGKALAVRSGVHGGVRAYHRKADRASFHSASVKGAQTVNVNNIGHPEPGKS
jgi:5-aminolevulinate synthase